MPDYPITREEIVGALPELSDETIAMLMGEPTPETVEADRMFRTWKRVRNHTSAAARARAHADRAHAMLNVLALRMHDGPYEGAAVITTAAQAHSDLAQAYAAVAAIPETAFARIEDESRDEDPTGFFG